MFRTTSRNPAFQSFRSLCIRRFKTFSCFLPKREAAVNNLQKIKLCEQRAGLKRALILPLMSLCVHDCRGL